MAIYFKAHQLKRENEAKRWSQQAWEMGVRVKEALATSIVAVGLWDGKHQPRDYSECPHTKIENNSNELDEQWVKNERLRCYAYFKSFGKHN